MTQIERDTLVQSISAMSEEEMRIALECIPIQYMLDHILDSSKKPKKQMTFREEAAKKEPERINVIYRGGVSGCPRDKNVNTCYIMNQVNCTKCWDRVIPDELMDND